MSPSMRKPFHKESVNARGLKTISVHAFVTPMKTVERTPLAVWMFKYGVTGRQLAERTGVSEPTISRMRNGSDQDFDPEAVEKVKAVTRLKKLV